MTQSFEHWVVADRLRRVVGIPYRINEAESLAQLVRLVGEAAANVAEDMGSLDTAARIREHFGPVMVSESTPARRSASAAP